MPSVIQPSFALGELSDDLSGRVDLEWYGKGLALCDNFYVLASGGVTFRPGTEYVGEVAHEKRARLLAFEFSATETYALLLEDLSCRFIQNGGFVVPESEADSGTPYSIELPYAAEELADLRYAQSADVIYLTHPDHPPAKLMRYGHTDWRYEVLTFASKLTAPKGLQASTSAGGGVTYRYKVTAFDKDAGEESEASAEASVASKDLGLDNTVVTLSWQAVSGAKEYKVYKFEAGMWGLVGYSEGTALSFRDQNYASDTTLSPPEYENPFAEQGNYPSVVAFIQQRLIFAGSRNDPQKIWMSRSGNFENFGRSNPTRDDDAVYLSISSSQVNWIRGLVSLRALLAMTGGAEWSVDAGGQGGPITPGTVNVTQQSAYGTANLEPRLVGQSILIAQRGFTAIRDLSYSFDIDGYAGNDLSIRAPHLFRGRSLHAWDYQNSPDGVLWCARDDGALLALTYVKEHQVYAWSQHHTDGFVEDVCCVNSDTRDELYLIVRRTIGGVERRYVERLAKPYRSGETAGETAGVTVGVANAHYADCALRYVGEPVERLFGLGHLAGKAVAVLADGGPLDNLRVDDAGELALPRPARNVLVGLPYTGTIKTMRVNTGDESGSSQGRKQTITRVTLRFRDSVGGETGWERIGMDGTVLETTWSELKTRTLQIANQPSRPFTGDRAHSLPSGWDTGGQFLFRQKDPLPMTLLCAIPEVTLGGR